MRAADLSAPAADDRGSGQRHIPAGYFTGGTGPAEEVGAGVTDYLITGKLVKKANRWQINETVGFLIFWRLYIQNSRYLLRLRENLWGTI